MKTLLEFIIEAKKEPSYKKDPTKYISSADMEYVLAAIFQTILRHKNTDSISVDDVKSEINAASKAGKRIKKFIDNNSEKFIDMCNGFREALSYDENFLNIYDEISDKSEVSVKKIGGTGKTDIQIQYKKDGKSIVSNMQVKNSEGAQWDATRRVDKKLDWMIDNTDDDDLKKELKQLKSDINDLKLKNKTKDDINDKLKELWGDEKFRELNCKHDLYGKDDDMKPNTCFIFNYDHPEQSISDTMDNMYQEIMDSDPKECPIRVDAGGRMRHDAKIVWAKSNGGEEDEDDKLFNELREKHKDDKNIRFIKGPRKGRYFQVRLDNGKWGEKQHISMLKDKS